MPQGNRMIKIRVIFVLWFRKTLFFTILDRRMNAKKKKKKIGER